MNWKLALIALAMFATLVTAAIVVSKLRRKCVECGARKHLIPGLPAIVCRDCYYRQP